MLHVMLSGNIIQVKHLFEKLKQCILLFFSDNPPIVDIYNQSSMPMAYQMTNHRLQSIISHITCMNPVNLLEGCPQDKLFTILLSDPAVNK